MFFIYLTMNIKIASYKWHGTEVLCRFFVLASLLATWVSCTNDSDVDLAFDGKGMSMATVASEYYDMPFDDDMTTRASINPTSSPISFSWEQGDVLAVYAQEGDGLTNFNIKEIDSQTPSHAKFQATGFNLKNGELYACFYPYNADATDKSSVPVNYDGQEQSSNNSYSHLGAVDYQYATAKAEGSTEAANIKFTLKHIGAICRFRITNVPAGVHYSRMSISHSNIIKSGTIDLTDTPTITSTTTGTQNIILGEAGSGISADQEGTLTVYVMMAPANLSGGNINIRLYCDKSDMYVYSADVAGKNMEAGKAYGYTAAYNAPVPSPAETDEWVDLGLKRTDGTAILFGKKNLGAASETGKGGTYTWTEADPVTAVRGVNWRTPTFEEMDALFNKGKDGYSLVWTNETELQCLKIARNDDSNIYMYLPYSIISGYSQSTQGVYWSATKSNDYPSSYMTTIGDNIVNSFNLTDLMSNTYFIRPVYVGPIQ